MESENQDEIRPDEQEASPWPRQQVYYVTVEWPDSVHKPESPERLAMVLRQAIEHGHSYPAGLPPTRFVVRVKAEDIVSEVTGTVVHHHHHHG